MTDDVVHEIVDMVVQRHITDLVDLYNEVPQQFDWAFLAAMKVTLEALLPRLSITDLAIYEHVVGNSQTTVLLSMFDPRRSREEADP